MAAKIHKLHELHRPVQLNFRHGGLYFHYSYEDDVMIFLHGPAGVWLEARRERRHGSRGGGRVSGRVGGEGNSQGGKKEGDQDTRTEKLVEVNIDFILSRVCPSNWALELGVKIQTGCKAISCCSMLNNKL